MGHVETLNQEVKALCMVNNELEFRKKCQSLHQFLRCFEPSKNQWEETNPGMSIEKFSRLKICPMRP